MYKRILLTAAATLALTAAGAAWAVEVRNGAAAYGDWRADAPGVIRHISPADVAPPGATQSSTNASRVVPKPAGAELHTMPGFTAAPFVTGMSGARVLRVAPNGDVFLSRSNAGTIMVIRAHPGASTPDLVAIYADTDLHTPYGLAFWPPGPNPTHLYVAEAGKVIRYPYKSGDLKPSGPAETVVADLAVGGTHWTRDVMFSRDGRTMFVAVGSASNVAADMGPPPPELAAFEKTHAVGAAWDKNEWRDNVLTYTPEGRDKKIYATGIRNCSGFTLQPGTDTVWCATNERDLLGDNTPPDYVTSVKPGGFYGWPWYYIGDHEDTRPGGGPRPDLKGKAIVPDVLIQPHSAPLGMAFNTGTMFPADMQGDAFVALHGSWNRALRTGYKIIRLPFRNGKPTGEYQDFVTGFAAGDADVWGRPVDVAFAADGALLFSDDGNGVVYRVSYKEK